jgi:hypothetical protein
MAHRSPDERTAASDAGAVVRDKAMVDSFGRTGSAGRGLVDSLGRMAIAGRDRVESFCTVAFPGGCTIGSFGGVAASDGVAVPEVTCCFSRFLRNILRMFSMMTYPIDGGVEPEIHKWRWALGGQRALPSVATTRLK